MIISIISRISIRHFQAFGNQGGSREALVGDVVYTQKLMKTYR